MPWRISLNKVRCDEEANNNKTLLMENNKKYLNFSTEFTSKDLEDGREYDQND